MFEHIHASSQIKICAELNRRREEGQNFIVAGIVEAGGMWNAFIDTLQVQQGETGESSTSEVQTVEEPQTSHEGSQGTSGVAQIPLATANTPAVFNPTPPPSHPRRGGGKGKE